MDLDDLDSLGSKDSNRNSQASVVSEDGEPLPTSPPAPLLSPSAHNYVRVKQERLRMGEVDSFRGINSADISQEQAQQSIEDPRFRTKVEAVLKRLLAFARSPGELATFLATELRATKVRCGYALCLIGEPADSMIVLVDGYAQVHAKERCSCTADRGRYMWASGPMRRETTHAQSKHVMSHDLCSESSRKELRHRAAIMCPAWRRLVRSGSLDRVLPSVRRHSWARSLVFFWLR